MDGKDHFWKQFDEQLENVCELDEMDRLQRMVNGMKSYMFTSVFSELTYRLVKKRAELEGIKEKKLASILDEARKVIEQAEYKKE